MAPNQNPSIALLRQARQQQRSGGGGQGGGNQGGRAASAKSAGHTALSRSDFYGYMVEHKYIYTPTGDLWPASSVNSRLPAVPLVDNYGNPILDADGNPMKIPSTKWIDQNQPVEQMTWMPGEPMLVRDRLVREGGWIDHKGATIFNLYRPPLIVPGNAAEAQRWLDHIDKVYPNDIEHIVRWLAHRRQRPFEKINHALVLGGAPGIGKDTLLEGPRHAVGPWNFQEIGPQQLTGRFNGWLKSIILRVNEARDLGEVNRYSLYDHLKSFTAAPPETLLCDEKNRQAYPIFNRTGVVITTNHKADGIYLPPDDRRHYVAWSDLTKADFVDGYWNGLWKWYDGGGYRHVVAYLDEFKLAKFDPKAPPPQTSAFWDIVYSSRAPEEGELRDLVEELQPPDGPDALTIAMLLIKSTGAIDEFLRERKNRRAIPHRLETCGYVPVRNPNAADGLWKVAAVLGGPKARQVIYAKAALSPHDRLNAAAAL
jgi:hypothetical protein